MLDKTEKEVTQEDFEKEMGVPIAKGEFERLLPYADQNAMGKLQALAIHRDALLRENETRIIQTAERLSEAIKNLVGT